MLSYNKILFLTSYIKTLITSCNQERNFIMQFIKNFFDTDRFVVGLTGIRKQTEYIKITVPEHFKKTYMPNIETNYLLF